MLDQMSRPPDGNQYRSQSQLGPVGHQQSGYGASPVPDGSQFLDPRPSMPQAVTNPNYANNAISYDQLGSMSIGAPVGRTSGRA